MADRAPFDRVIRAAAGAEPWAFEELWRDLDPALRRYLRVAAPDAVDDIASETWLRVARDVGRFRGDEGGFRRWFFTIARHQVIDYARAEGRRRSDPVPAEAFTGALDRPAGDDPIEHGLSTAAALQILRALPRDQADAIALRVLGGLPVEDVAKVMGKRAGTVRVLTHRGLQRLAELLGEHGV